MKTVTCSRCPHTESAATEKDALLKMQSHVHNAHAQRSADVKKIMKAAQKNIRDGTPMM